KMPVLRRHFFVSKGAEGRIGAQGESAAERTGRAYWPVFSGNRFRPGGIRGICLPGTPLFPGSLPLHLQLKLYLKINPALVMKFFHNRYDEIKKGGKERMKKI